MVTPIKGNNGCDKMKKEDSKIILKGVPASPGRVKGIVKVLMVPEDANKMNKGDILVAPETNPQYLFAIKRTSAIITDRGGILSHAAIVAREYGIPGIVGTLEATKKLKDGMEVTVDGEKGIVYE